MLKNKVLPLVLGLSFASGIYACSGSDTTVAAGGASAVAGAPAAGAPVTPAAGAAAVAGAANAVAGAPAGGASGGSGGASAAGASASGGASTSGGATGSAGAGGATLTIAQACTKNCTLAAGLSGCSTTMDVCVQSCLTTLDNTTKVNPDLGRQYTEMMVCVATNPKFASAADFVCAKPMRALNLWSPGGDSDCEQYICDWNCMDGTTGNIDPYVDIRCACSSV